MTQVNEARSPRWLNWSLRRTSPWHIAYGESHEPLCGVRYKNAPEWSHGHRPDDVAARVAPRFCSACEFEYAEDCRESREAANG